MFGGYPGQQRGGNEQWSGHGQQQIQPFDGFGGQGGGRAPQDPFAMMDEMMMMPFGGMGSRRGSGGFGGGMFESMFGQMGQMMQEMDQMAMGGGQMRSRSGSGGNGMMMSSSMGGGSAGSFSCQTFSFSSSMGADGQVHTEQFSSSSVGDRKRNVHEVQQAYSNSRTGVDKMSMERQMEGRGRKMVKERLRESGEERQTEMFKGMTEDQAGEFDQQWQQRAAPWLPQHQMGGGRRMVGDQGMQGRRHTQAALPSSEGHGGYGGYAQARPSSSSSQRLSWY